MSQQEALDSSFKGRFKELRWFLKTGSFILGFFIHHVLNTGALTNSARRRSFSKCKDDNCLFTKIGTIRRILDYPTSNEKSIIKTAVLS